MIKTELCKGDKVHIIRGEGRLLVDEKKQKVLCTVLKIDRVKGKAILEVPRPKAKRGEKELPVRGAEVWKTVRYNPKSGEAGGLKIVKRWLALANLKLAEKGARREAPVKK
jgi:ribosomal protein L24